MTDPQQTTAQLVATYEAGATIAEVAAQAGISTTWAWRRLKAGGAKLRGRARPQGSKNASSTWHAVAIAGRQNGEPCKVIARRLGVSPGAVSQAARGRCGHDGR